MAKGKITLEELEAKLLDIDVPDRELRAYFTGDRRRSRAFEPRVRPDPRRVETRAAEEALVEAASAMDWGNRFARWRRRMRFRRRLLTTPDPRILVAEGDSWFQFPILIDDVVDQLDRQWLVSCRSEAGDTLQRMVFDVPEYMLDLEELRGRVTAFIFSGGGNDVVGEDVAGHRSVLVGLLRPFEPGRPAEWYVDTDAFRDKLAFCERAYRRVIEEVGREHPGLPVILHGYDRAIPFAGTGDPRDPSWARPDEWLAGPMAAAPLGITSSQLQREIVAVMINRLNEAQRRLCGGNVAGGAFPQAYHVDVRGLLPDIAGWADELHPTDAGFAQVAAAFQRVLAAAEAAPIQPAMAVVRPRLEGRVAAASAASLAGGAMATDLRQAKTTLVSRFLRVEPAVASAAAIAITAGRTAPAPELNVVGVGTGERVVDRVPTGEAAVKVYVRRKYPLGVIGAGERLPAHVDGVPVDVEEVGDVWAAAAVNPRLSYAPVPPGVSIGHGERIMAGTLGARVRDAQGDVHLLSNNHVLADTDRLAPGTPIFQAGLLDLGDPTQPRRIASLARFVPLRPEPRRVDAALATPDDPDGLLAEILGIGAPAGTAVAKRDMIVHKCGRTSGYTVGRVTSVDTDIKVAYDADLLLFDDQVVIVGLSAGMQFGTQGDSGALILERGSGLAVALLFAASPTHVFANHLGDVLTALQVQLG